MGIYPGQDKELAIPDLFGQYSEFARLLELLPEWVECVMLPGNHDAVRPAEPQPTFEKDILLKGGLRLCWANCVVISW